jgi:hypothetical protein
MQRQPINPWSWSEKLGFDQAELIPATSVSSSAADKTPSTPKGAPSIQAIWPRN